MNTVYEFGDGRKTAMPSDDLIDVDIDDYYGGDEGPDPDSQSGHAESDLPYPEDANDPAFAETGWTARRKQASVPTLTYLSDPGHGWLGVPIDLFPDAPSFSTGYSYYDSKTNTIWLEEDEEAPAFKRAHEGEFGIVEKNEPFDDAWVRSLPVMQITPVASRLNKGNAVSKLSPSEAARLRKFRATVQRNAPKVATEMWNEMEQTADGIRVFHHYTPLDGYNLELTYVDDSGRERSNRYYDYEKISDAIDAFREELEIPVPAGEPYITMQFGSSKRSRASRKTAESAYDIISDPAPGWASWSDPRLQDAMLGAIQEFATTNPTPDKIIARLGEAFAMAGGYRDSIDRERAFVAAEVVTGWDYDTIYRAWLNGWRAGRNGPDGWGAEHIEASKRRRGSRKTALPDYKCSQCGDITKSNFPGDLCLACWEKSPESQRMVSADELVSMWGGPARRSASRKTAEYNGWANRVTWNIALWIGNDEGLYRMALDYPDYESFADALREFDMTETPDGVSFRDSGLDIAALDEMFEEFRSEGKRKAKKRKVTARQEVSSPFLPAGTYVVGDPCYAIPNDEWIPWLENADYRSDPDVLAAHTPSGHFCAAVGTEYGDGSYPGSNGRSYGVDAGLIGVVPIELAQSGDNQSWTQGLSSVETFNSPFTVSRDDEGTIYIGNNLSIQTGDSYDDDDDDWDEDEDDYRYSSRRLAGKAASRRRGSRRPARKRAALMPFDIVAYTYKADVYMPEDLIERLIADGIASPGARGMYVEEVLDQIAGANAIDRDDESSFDSDEFPKVVFRDQFDDDQFYFDGRESRRKNSNVRKTAQDNRFKVEYQGLWLSFDKERDAFQEALEWASHHAMDNGQAETVRVLFWEVSGPGGSPADQPGWDPYAEVTVKPIYEGRRSY